MGEFWESLFQKQGTSWGLEPCDSAIQASEIFHESGFSNVLIPGIGYGRNATPFLDKGMNVSGIEISKTALSLLRDSMNSIKIFHGSVLDMPFDNAKYDGIFCYALLHLFGKQQRKKIISSCFDQLKLNGLMVFSVVSPESELFTTGKIIGRNRAQMQNKLKVFFYDDSDIEKEFSKFGLLEYRDMDEPIKFRMDEPPMKFKWIMCKKTKL